MPKIYLSPSTQEYNIYVNGGNEEEYMNLIADNMEPYLTSSGIGFVRNDRSKTVSNSIAASNAGNYDLHFAIHSNASPPASAGRTRGADVYYYTASKSGKRAASVVAENYKEVYPLPSLVRTVPTTSLAELLKTRAPAVLIETAFHDNVQDADFIKANIAGIARNFVQSITEYFELPFIEATAPQSGIITTNSGALNIRSRPDTTAAVIGQAPKGARLTVNGRFDNWYVIRYQNIIGYVSAPFVTV